MAAYALLNRMRLISSGSVVDAADQTLKDIVKQYFEPHVSIEELPKMAASGRADPLKEFSTVARQELLRLNREI